MIWRGTKRALIAAEGLVVRRRVAHHLTGETDNELTVGAQDRGVELAVLDRLELLLRSAHVERDLGVLHPFVVRPRGHRGDARDRELAQQGVELVGIEHRAAEPQPARKARWALATMRKMPRSGALASSSATRGSAWSGSR